MKIQPCMTDETERDPQLSFRLSLLGFACMVASDLISIKGFNLAAAGGLLSAEGMLFSRSVLTAFLLGGLLGSVVCLGVSARRFPRTIADRSFLLLGMALFVVGIACVLAIDYVAGVPPYLGVVGGVVIGFGNAFLLVLWGRVYKGLGLRQALAHGAVSLALGVTLSVLTLLFLENHGQVYVWIVCQAFACVALMRELPKIAPETPDAAVSLKRSLKEAGSYVWMVLVGLGIFCFVFGMYWGHNLSMVFYDSFLEVVVSWVSAGVLLLFAVRDRTARRFDLLYRISMPAASLLLLADPFLAFVEPGINFASGVFLALCFIFFGAVNWVVFSQAAARRPSISDELFSIDLGCCCLMFSLGILLNSLVGLDNLRVVASVAVVVFVIVVIASYVVAQNAPRGAIAVSMSEDALTESKARRMAERYALSKREAEVLMYLIKGHGSEFIGDKLFIATSTVQTHRKRIYKKLDVSSREELLELASTF